MWHDDKLLQFLACQRFGLNSVLLVPKPFIILYYVLFAHGSCRSMKFLSGQEVSPVISAEHESPGFGTAYWGPYSCSVFQDNVREMPALSFHKRQLNSVSSRFPEWQMSELIHCSIQHIFYPDKYWKHIYCNIEGIRVFRKGKSDPSLSCAAFQHSPSCASTHQQLKSLTINKLGWDQCSWVCSC